MLVAAATGRGKFVRLAEDHAATLRLSVGPYRVRMSIDKQDNTLWVWAVYRLDR